jgi:hypothetical protein
MATGNDIQSVSALLKRVNKASSTQVNLNGATKAPISGTNTLAEFLTHAKVTPETTPIFLGNSVTKPNSNQVVSSIQPTTGVSTSPILTAQIAASNPSVGTVLVAGPLLPNQTRGTATMATTTTETPVNTTTQTDNTTTTTQETPVDNTPSPTSSSNWFLLAILALGAYLVWKGKQ